MDVTQTDEVVVAPTEESVPDPLDTASTDTPEENQPVPEAKTFTQEQVDAIIAKRVAKESRRNERELLRKVELLEKRIYEKPQPEAPISRIDRSQFSNDQDYIDALVEQKLERQLSDQRQKEELKTVAQIDAKKEKILSEAESSGEFDRDEFLNSVPITDLMAEAIIESDLGPKLILHLNANPSEAERIANLPKARQAAELGKLEVILSNAKAQKSAAPSPIAPLSGSGKVSKDPALMSDAEFAKWRKGQIANRGN